MIKNKPKISINKCKFKNEYRCRVRVNGKNNHIGYFKDIKQAYHEALTFIESREQN